MWIYSYLYTQLWRAINGTLATQWIHDKTCRIYFNAHFSSKIWLPNYDCFKLFSHFKTRDSLRHFWVQWKKQICEVLPTWIPQLTMQMECRILHTKYCPIMAEWNLWGEEVGNGRKKGSSRVRVRGWYLFCSTRCQWKIIIRHELGLNRPVLASSNSFFKVFQVVVVHLVYISALFLASLLFIPVVCRSQSDFYLLSFSSAGSIFSSSKISSCLLWSKICTLLFFRKISSRLVSIVFLLFFLRSQISLLYKRMGTAGVDTVTN